MADCVEDKAFDITSKNCVTFTPGIVNRLRILPTQHVLAIPATDTTDTDSDGIPDKPLEITADVTIDTTNYPDAEWKIWDCQENKGRLRITTPGDAGSRSISAEVTARIPGDDPLAMWVISQGLNVPTLVGVTTKTNRDRLVGTKQIPAYMNWEYDSGEGEGDEVGILVTFTASGLPTAPPYYSGAYS